jgi:hypothetical protein
MEEGLLRDIPSELGEWKFYFSRTKLQNGRTRFVVEGEGTGKLLGISTRAGISDAFDMTEEGVRPGNTGERRIMRQDLTSRSTDARRRSFAPPLN